MKRIAFILFILIASVHTFAQTADEIVKTKHIFDKKIPSFIDIVQKDSPNVNNDGKSYLEKLLLLNKGTTAVLTQTYKDKVGGYHEIFKEYYQGIEVEGSKYILHYDNDGRIYKASGCFWTIEKLNTTPRLSEKEALASSLRQLDAKMYAWEDVNNEKRIKAIKGDSTATYYPRGQLVVYVKDEKPYLAYKFNIVTQSPEMDYCVYVDAENGEIIYKYNTICDISTNVSTHYSGDKIVQTTYSSSQYRLRDYTRGNGIETYKYSLGNSQQDYCSSDNTWSNMTYNDRYAFDVHWGSEKVYDFYMSKFGRNSYDGNGGKIISYVNVDTIYNAEWHPADHTIHYGLLSYDEICGNCPPLVTLDVVAHEITHGVTMTSCGLSNYGESGAISEGLSDIFAVCVEKWVEPAKGDSIWKIGEEICCIRDLSNPDCKYYHGENWKNTSNLNDGDHGGIHTNCTVLGYWFYLLVNGGTGYNQSGMSIPVSGIGLDNAINICYHTCLLIPQYCNFYYFSESTCEAARELGYSDNVIQQIRNAWFDVGVLTASEVLSINGPNNVGQSAIYYVNNLPQGTTVQWWLSDSYYNNKQLQQNTPSVNKCKITAATCYDMENANMAAVVWHNVLVNGSLEPSIAGTVWKNNINATKTGVISGTYYNGQTTKNFNLPNPLYVLPNITVTITSPCLKETTVSYSGSFTPTTWQHNNSAGTLVFSAPDSGTLIVQMVHNNGVTHNLPVIITTNTHLLSVGISDGLIEVSIIPESEENRFEDIRTNTPKQELEWKLEVFNAATGEMVFSQDIIGKSFSINTAGWESGIYIVRVTVGNEVLSEKVVVN